MQLKKIFECICILVSVTAGSCSEITDDLKLNPDEDNDLGFLTISVSMKDFNDVGDEMLTRASYNGDAVSLQKGDAIGLTLYKNDGTIVYNNVKYTYNGTTWESTNPIGKLNGATKYTASFPYKSEFSGKITSAQLLAASPLKTDNGVIQIMNDDDYKAADIMADTEKPASYKLNIKLSHLRACISVDKPMGTFFWEYDYTDRHATQVALGYRDFYLYKSDKITKIAHRPLPNTIMAKTAYLYKILIDPGTKSESYLGMIDGHGVFFDINKKSKEFKSGCRYHHIIKMETHEFGWRDLGIGDRVVKYGGKYYALPAENPATMGVFFINNSNAEITEYQDVARVFARVETDTEIFYDLVFLQTNQGFYGTAANDAAVKEAYLKVIGDVWHYIKEPYENFSWNPTIQITDPNMLNGVDWYVWSVNNKTANNTYENYQIDNAIASLRNNFGISGTNITTTKPTNFTYNDYVASAPVNVSTVTPWYLPTTKDIVILRDSGRLPNFDFYVTACNIEVGSNIVRYSPASGTFYIENITQFGGWGDYFTRIKVTK